MALKILQSNNFFLDPLSLIRDFNKTKIVAYPLLHCLCLKTLNQNCIHGANASWSCVVQDSQAWESEQKTMKESLFSH